MMRNFCFLFVLVLHFLCAVSIAAAQDVSSVDCDFELPTLCGYEQVYGTSDQFDWTRKQRSTPTANTGPAGDHTTGHGYYMYTETSSPRVTGDNAILLTPTLNWTSSLTCLTFWYSMNGMTMGTLEVLSVSPDLRTNLHTVWSRTSSQGPDWLQAKVTVNTASTVRFGFNGTRGIGIYSDIAIDDVKATQGGCVQVDCDFEDNILCGWSNVQDGTDQLDWTVQYSQDHTTDSGAGHFASISFGNSSVIPGGTAFMVSPVHSPLPHPFCLMFWYRLDGGTGDHLDVFQVDNVTRQGVAKWSLAGHQPSGWHEAAVPLFYTKTFNIVLRGTVSGGSGSVSVDDIVFHENDNCTTSPAGARPNSSEFITLGPPQTTTAKVMSAQHAESTRPHTITSTTTLATSTRYTAQDFPRTVDVSLFTSCDFETDCHYENGPGDFSWSLHNSRTTTGGTGPDTDHTTRTYSGHYAYTEASNHAGKKAVVLTAELPATLDNVCLQFWYHMYGRGIGTLNIKLAHNSSVLDQTLWTLSGDQGNQWHLAQVTLPSTELTQKFKIAFEGVMLSGSALASYGDIALDDIETAPKECPADAAKAAAATTRTTVTTTTPTTTTATTTTAPTTTTNTQTHGHNATDNQGHADLGVRLQGGESLAEGKLEVYHNGHWGTVCDDNFGNSEARVVCRQLQLDSAEIPEVYSEAHYGEGTDLPIWLDDVMCIGSEVSVEQCRHNGWGQHDCTHAEDVSIICTHGPLIRLANGSNDHEGRVEVYSPGGWGTVCDNDFDIKDARVVCSMLGLPTFNPAVRTEAYFGQGHGIVLISDLDCQGSEVTIDDCLRKLHSEHTCTHEQDVGVICSEMPTVRLVNSSNEWEGRLEVLHGDAWGTVCDDGFGVQEAAVVCRMLGLDSSAPVVHHNAVYGPGTGPILLDEVKCLGAEIDIALCSHAPWGLTDCSHSEDVGIACPALRNVRLVNGSTESEGRVELYVDGQWGTVCDEDFDQKDALVVCRMMGLERNFEPSSVVVHLGAHFGPGAGHVLMGNLECEGHETDLQQCPHKAASPIFCPHDRDVGVTCANADTPLIG